MKVKRILDFKEKKDLKTWLLAQKIDLQKWNAGHAKTFDNLWDEYLEGEVAFQEEPPMRLVQVVQVIIHRNDLILLEGKQEFGDGRIRSRMQPPSEKFKFNEDRRQAAIRCVQEELGAAPDRVEVFQAELEVQEKFDSSPSYPGLKTRYKIYPVVVHVRGLPEDDFWRENQSYGERDPIKRHKWIWQEEAGLGFLFE